MSWTYITRDPETLPPLDTPVFLLLDEETAITGERTIPDSDGWLWAKCYGDPVFQDGKWQVDSAEIDYLQPIAWHPMPQLPEAIKS